MEVIGTYDPIPKVDPYDNTGKLHKDIKLDLERARYWVGVGAQPSDTAWRILSMVSALSVFLASSGDPALSWEAWGTASGGTLRVRLDTNRDPGRHTPQATVRRFDAKVHAPSRHAGPDSDSDDGSTLGVSLGHYAKLDVTLRYSKPCINIDRAC